MQQDDGLWVIRSIGNRSILVVQGVPEDGATFIGTGTSAFELMKKIPIVVACICSLPDYSIYFPGFNADMSGDPTPGTPVELRARWNAANQVWGFRRA